MNNRFSSCYLRLNVGRTLRRQPLVNLPRVHRELGTRPLASALSAVLLVQKGGDAEQSPSRIKVVLLCARRRVMRVLSFIHFDEGVPVLRISKDTHSKYSVGKGLRNIYMNLCSVITRALMRMTIRFFHTQQEVRVNRNSCLITYLRAFCRVGHTILPSAVAQWVRLRS